MSAVQTVWPEQAGLSGAAHRGQASQGPPIPGDQSSAHGDPPHWKQHAGIAKAEDAKRGLYLLDQVYELMYEVAKK